MGSIEPVETARSVFLPLDARRTLDQIQDVIQRLVRNLKRESVTAAKNALVGSDLDAVPPFQPRKDELQTFVLETLSRIGNPLGIADGVDRFNGRIPRRTIKCQPPTRQ